MDTWRFPTEQESANERNTMPVNDKSLQSSPYHRPLSPCLFLPLHQAPQTFIDRRSSEMCRQMDPQAAHSDVPDLSSVPRYIKTPPNVSSYDVPPYPPSPKDFSPDHAPPIPSASNDPFVDTANGAFEQKPCVYTINGTSDRNSYVIDATSDTFTNSTNRASESHPHYSGVHIHPFLQPALHQPHLALSQTHFPQHQQQPDLSYTYDAPYQQQRYQADSSDSHVLNHPRHYQHHNRHSQPPPPQQQHGPCFPVGGPNNATKTFPFLDPISRITRILQFVDVCHREVDEIVSGVRGMGIARPLEDDGVHGEGADDGGREREGGGVPVNRDGKQNKRNGQEANEKGHYHQESGTGSMCASFGENRVKEAVSQGLFEGVLPEVTGLGARVALAGRLMMGESGGKVKTWCG